MADARGPLPLPGIPPLLSPSNSDAPPALGLGRPLREYAESDYSPPPYLPPGRVEEQHAFPRFGHPNDFGVLLRASSWRDGGEPARDYIVGVCAGAMLILAIGLVWFMVIVGLKVAGRGRVGFLAGRLVHPDALAARRGSALPSIPEEASTEDETSTETEAAAAGAASTLSAPLILGKQVEESARSEEKFKRRVVGARAAFALGGLGVIVSSVLYYAEGIASFRDSLDSVHGGLELVRYTANEAIRVVDDVVSDKDGLVFELDRINSETGGMLCERDGGVASKLSQDMGELTKKVEELNQVIDNNVAAFRGDLEKVSEITEGVDSRVNVADGYLYAALAVSVVVVALIVAMLAVSFFSAREVTNCCTKFTTNAILWPVFVFFLIVFWILGLLFMVTSLAGSDFCVKPDEVVQNVLMDHKEQFNSVIFEHVIYYVSGCEIKPDLEQARSMEERVSGIIGTVHGISERAMGIEFGPALRRKCGMDRAAASAFTTSAGIMHNATHAINNAWIGVRHLLECGTFNPIYITFVHKAVCIEGVGGLTWIFSTSLAVFCFAMLMITFRAALSPIKRSASRGAEGSGLFSSFASSGR